MGTFDLANTSRCYSIALSLLGCSFNCQAFETLFFITFWVLTLLSCKKTRELKQRCDWDADSNQKKKKITMACLDISGLTKRPALWHFKLTCTDQRGILSIGKNSHLIISFVIIDRQIRVYIFGCHLIGLMSLFLGVFVFATTQSKKSLRVSITGYIFFTPAVCGQTVKY